MKLWIGLFLSILSLELHASIEWQVIGKHANGTIQTEIKQTLPTGWHTYWKNPGDSGEKATIISLNSFASFGELEFPKPTLIPVDPFVTYGYYNQVTYQLPITLNRKTTKLSASYQWLECEEVCIPKDTVLTLAIPTNIPTITQSAPPPPTVSIEKRGSRIVFTLNETPESAEFFPYKNNEFNLKKMKLKNNALTVPLEKKSLTSVEGELFINNQKGHIIKTEAISTTPAYLKLLVTLFGAFFGGLLLNIMPCVLPILGIKAIQLNQRQEKKPPYQDALNYFFGIALALFTLYGILLGIKLTGTSVGWGFQLQSPLMIQTLILLFLTIMCINLDLLHIPLPKFASQKSNNMILNGILTTVIATPCTAPFLGSALSIALFQSPLIGLLIFSAISLGLALPMALIITVPAFRNALPKSGQWNQSFKYYLNIGFILTIGWLMWVLSSQINPSAQLAFFSSTITLFCIIIFKSKANIKRPLVMLILTAFVGLTPVFITPSNNQNWLPYTTELRQSLETKNTPYLIDITAKWCITCQTNKISVLNTKDSMRLLNNNNITLIKADWTNKSEEITALLEEFNQASIPTYIYYNGSKHIVFGDILTSQKLKSKIESSL